MLNRLIDFSLRHRSFVILVTVALGAVGVVSLTHLDIDAFPDTTPVQIQINTIAPSLAPEETERQITFPIEQAISGLPHLEMLRSISKSNPASRGTPALGWHPLNKLNINML